MRGPLYSSGSAPVGLGWVDFAAVESAAGRLYSEAVCTPACLTGGIVVSAAGIWFES